MSVLSAAFAQLLHCALMLAAAPLVAGLLRSAEALFSGHAAPPPWQPWRDLIRLSRKPASRVESASAVSGAVPVLCFAAAAVAAFLVPSFTLGMAFAPLADLLALFGLLASARIALALAALDPGTALAGVTAARMAALGCWAGPASFLVILALAVLGGTTNLELLVGLQRQGMLQPLSAAVLAGAALVLLALASPDAAPMIEEASGADLALLHWAEALRLVFWLDLLGGLFLPFGIAAPDAGLLAWSVGLLSWAVKTAGLVAILAALRCRLGDLKLRQMPQAIGIAGALGLLAALLVLASAAPP